MLSVSSPASLPGKNHRQKKVKTHSLETLSKSLDNQGNMQLILLCQTIPSPWNISPTYQGSTQLKQSTAELVHIYHGWLTK